MGELYPVSIEDLIIVSEYSDLLLTDTRLHPGYDDCNRSSGHLCIVTSHDCTHHLPMVYLLLLLGSTPVVWDKNMVSREIENEISKRSKIHTLQPNEN